MRSLVEQAIATVPVVWRRTGRSGAALLRRRPLPRRAHENAWVAGATEAQPRDFVPDMKWHMEFYHERRGILARYGIEAPLPAAAVVLGRRALLAESPSPPPARRASLFKQAQLIEGQNADEWILYRIVCDDSGMLASPPTP
jgi:hypothetical protein